MPRSGGWTRPAFISAARYHRGSRCHRWDHHGQRGL